MLQKHGHRSSMVTASAGCAVGPVPATVRNPNSGHLSFQMATTKIRCQSRDLFGRSRFLEQMCGTGYHFELHGRAHPAHRLTIHLFGYRAVPAAEPAAAAPVREDHETGCTLRDVEIIQRAALRSRRWRTLKSYVAHRKDDLCGLDRVAEGGVRSRHVASHSGKQRSRTSIAT
jgi:hypothetical protein